MCRERQPEVDLFSFDAFWHHRFCNGKLQDSKTRVFQPKTSRRNSPTKGTVNFRLHVRGSRTSVLKLPINFSMQFFADFETVGNITPHKNALRTDYFSTEALYWGLTHERRPLFRGSATRPRNPKREPARTLGIMVRFGLGYSDFQSNSSATANFLQLLTLQLLYYFLENGGTINK